MRRTQLYLPEQVWKSLHVRSRQRGASISELVRQALGEKYGASPASRRQAMLALVGLRKGRKDAGDARTYLRRLRKGNRLKRLAT